MGCNTSQEQKAAVNEGDEGDGAAGAEEKNQENHTNGDDNNDTKSEKKSAKSSKNEKDNGHIDTNDSKNEGETISNLFMQCRLYVRVSICMCVCCVLVGVQQNTPSVQHRLHICCCCWMR